VATSWPPLAGLNATESVLLDGATIEIGAVWLAPPGTVCGVTIASGPAPHEPLTIELR